MQGAAVVELGDYSATTVLLGRHNPLIFAPEWLHQHNVIGPDEASQAREAGIEVMAPNYASIAIGTMKLNVEEERFQLTVSDEPLVRAKDFPASCFRLLSHTPIFAVGLNLTARLRQTDLDAWHRFGDRLAPKEAWGDFVTGDGGARLGGMRGLAMERMEGLGGRDGYTRVTIQTSDSEAATAGIQVNNHFALGDSGNPKSGLDAYMIIEQMWDEAFEFSKSLIERIKDFADVV